MSTPENRDQGIGNREQGSKAILSDGKFQKHDSDK
jgi:hypothetical protein